MSLVVPVYNEIEAIPAFIEHAQAACEATSQKIGRVIEVEYVFTDDGSTDGTLDALLKLRETVDRVVVVELSRNFGKEAALTAGLRATTGDGVIPMDIDLQDPPMLIVELVTKWLEGYDVVLAKRMRRDSDTFLKRWTAASFYKIHNVISRTHIPYNVGDFRLMDRFVVDELNKLDENQRFMKGLFAWVGFKTATVEYDRPMRVHGETKFRGWTLWNLALEGVTSFSAAPLKIWTYIGMVISLFAFVMAGIVVFQHLFLNLDIPGYTLIAVAIFFFSGIQLISIGLLGEYLARIYMESKGRPSYIVRKTHKGAGQ